MKNVNKKILFHNFTISVLLYLILRSDGMKIIIKSLLHFRDDKSNFIVLKIFN